MRTSILPIFAIALMMSIPASSRAQGQTPAPANGAPSKVLRVRGIVSDDGKMLITDIGSEWSVSNVSVLKGQEGRAVTVKCFVDTERSLIQVLSFRREDGDSRYAAKYSDSAFRR
jgi:hypothetical protein